MSLKRVREDSQASSLGSAEQPGQKPGADASGLQPFGVTTPDNTSRQLFARPLGRLVEDRSRISETRYFGPTSLNYLMLEFGDLISHQVSLDFQAWGDTGVLIQDRINAFVGCSKSKLRTGVISPPTGPPLAILDAMTDPYFANVNPSFPIWKKDKFLEMVDSLRHPSNRAESRWASIVCCNNVILLSLNADSVRSVQRKMAQSGMTGNVSSLDSDLIAGFLANSKCAVENLGLVSPCLVNLQALLSLCVVAREHLPLHTVEHLFAQTVRCAEAIGIFQWRHLQSQLGESEFEEYKNVAHCLYILDKNICWTAGISPKLLESDVQLDLTPRDRTFETLARQAELAAIQEAIYFQLYASQVKARTEDQVRQVVTPLWQRLEKWLAKSEVNLDATKSQPQSCPTHTALAFQTLSTQLLLISPYRKHPDAMFRQRASVAETCLKLLLSLWTSAKESPKHTSVPLLIASCPPLYLLEICAAIIKDNSSDSNKHLVLGFANLVNAITGFGEEVTYKKRLCDMLSILKDAITAADALGKRQRGTTSLEYPSPPSSNDRGAQKRKDAASTETPAEGDGSSLQAGRAARGAQNFDGSEFSFSAWWGPEARISPVDLGEGDVQSNSADNYCSFDETMGGDGLDTWMQ
ncbi:hypothetical protein E4U42_002770 [Claviceps africana]|uniref:Xylanolytic transcriptional activator regulatory domain-containing protein n=1 Tax=Claviceps africana TaxID=83212 RepID=A0A8K0J849_9HYPO|nr:hypothetical protein E4U42_002770 [Claviceps africana]